MPAPEDTTATGHEPLPPATVPRTMRAAVRNRYGPPEQVVEIASVPVPRPGVGDVLIRVAASSINALDWHYTTGLPMFARLSIGLRRPRSRIPGADASGTVVAVGADVPGAKVGDEVIAEVGDGGFAEFVCASAERVIARPASLDLVDSATLGVASLTALQGLRDWGGVRPGHRVLIIGASGGVGTFAVQLARALGAAHIAAVCSTRNIETARDLGADRVIDYTAEPITAEGGPYDVVFDNAGSLSLTACRALTAPGGRYVMVTGRKSRWIHPLPRLVAGPLAFVGRPQTGVIGKVATQSRTDLQFLADLVDRGLLRPVVERRFALEDAADALRIQGEFHSQGKSVVLP